LPRQTNEQILLLQQRTKLLLWEKQELPNAKFNSQRKWIYYQEYMKPLPGLCSNWQWFIHSTFMEHQVDDELNANEIKMNKSHALKVFTIYTEHSKLFGFGLYRWDS